MRGTWRKSSFTGSPEGCANKALGIGVCFHGCPALGDLGGMLLS